MNVRKYDLRVWLIYDKHPVYFKITLVCLNLIMKMAIPKFSLLAPVAQKKWTYIEHP